jgi:hypothetical protein
MPNQTGVLNRKAEIDLTKQLISFHNLKMLIR